MAATIIPFPARPAPDPQRQRQLAIDAEASTFEARLEALVMEAMADVLDADAQATEDGRLAMLIAERIKAAPRRK